jgi:methanogenic corrinoid protein MtbC1
MNNIKNTFSIKDLENLSGIKAHTIRIWEKRYNLLEPERTDTNIRTYNLDNLQKLLNVSYLNNNGYKISKIATLENGKIPTIVNEIAQKDSIQNPAINDFKIAMLNFDQSKFYSIYKSLNKEKSFRDIFYDIFIPLLTDIGLLWQTNTITPAHEHFISSFIRYKILVNTELIQDENKLTSNKTFVLYLPDNEIHELGLMFINYELISKGYQSIFLGQSVPIDNLKELINLNSEVVFISYFTIKPEAEELLGYLQDFENKILSQSNVKFWILGKMLDNFNNNKLPKNITAFSSITDLVKVL